MFVCRNVKNLVSLAKHDTLGFLNRMTYIKWFSLVKQWFLGIFLHSEVLNY